MSDGNTLHEDIPISTVDSPSVVLELIYRLKIKDVMTSAVITAKKTDTLRHIQAVMRENYITGLPIAEDRRLLGLVSIDDIVTALDKGYIDDTAEERMTKNVIVLEDDMPVSFAISYLNKFRYGRFPVLNKNRELVGILSSKDVIRTLLVEMNREVLRLEKIQHEKAPPSGEVSEMDFKTTRYDFELAGHASTEIKKALKRLNIDPKIIRRIAIASYELEINQVVHSLGGTISCSIQPEKVIITAADKGPGIADVEVAIQEGWSTANEWIRSLGFGAGMGLANTKRVSDEFIIESSQGAGTTVQSIIYLNKNGEDNE
ncbi:CBS domain-containing protein [Breznakiella homolactica]|uniref:CBS domain-containing protein n=1 Tax=Breznakiella homolactica TaxID=2798577 RepID=A0A7T7XN80_9SPIR|nr:CBS domain-containing protein [Breznakiella homolactica]QQO09398.1 CBS domain-containing protein [Breznakiella homolactica]